MKEPALALLFAAAVVLGAAGLWVLGDALQDPPVDPPESNLSLRLRIEAVDWNVEYSAESANNTAFALLVEASEIQDFDVEYSRWEVPPGIKVDAIHGFVDGEQGGRWWQYWVNDVYGDVSADRRELHDGDVVVWRYATYPPPAVGP